MSCYSGSCQFFSREVSSKAGGRSRKVCASIKKVHGYFQFYVHKHRMQLHLLHVTFQKLGLLAIAKCLLTFALCVSTGLCICLSWVTVNSGLFEANEKENKLIWQVKRDHWHVMWFLYLSISHRGTKHRQQFQVQCLGLNCRFTQILSFSVCFVFVIESCLLG